MLDPREIGLVTLRASIQGLDDHAASVHHEDEPAALDDSSPSTWLPSNQLRFDLETNNISTLTLTSSRCPEDTRRVTNLWRQFLIGNVAPAFVPTSALTVVLVKHSPEAGKAPKLYSNLKPSHRSSTSYRSSGTSCRPLSSASSKGDVILCAQCFRRGNG